MVHLKWFQARPLSVNPAEKEWCLNSQKERSKAAPQSETLWVIAEAK